MSLLTLSLINIGLSGINFYYYINNDSKWNLAAGIFSGTAGLIGLAPFLIF